MNEDSAEALIPRRLVFGTITGITSVQVVTTMAAIIPAAIAPKIADALELPVSMIGFQVSLAYVGATLMSIPAGLIVRRLGAVRTSQIAAALVALSLCIIAVPHVAALAIGTLGIGCAYGITNPSASHLMMKIANEGNRNLIFSIKQTGQPLGGVVAGLMAPPVAVAFGWQFAPLAGVVIALSVLVAIHPLRRHLDGDRDPRTRFRGAVFQDVGVVIRTRSLRLLSLAALVFSGVQLALMTFAVTMLVEDVELDLVTAGAGLAVLQVAGVVGRLGWGIIADKVKSGLGTLLAAQVVSIVGALATASLAPGWPLAAVYGVLFLYGVSAIGWNGVFMAEIARFAPEGRIGSATGGALVPTFIGVILGPMLFTALHGFAGGYTATFAVMAGFTVIGLLPILALRARS